METGERQLRLSVHTIITTWSHYYRFLHYLVRKIRSCLDLKTKFSE